MIFRVKTDFPTVSFKDEYRAILLVDYFDEGPNSIEIVDQHKLEDCSRRGVVIFWSSIAGSKIIA